jgi:hypothetical protein
LEVHNCFYSYVLISSRYLIKTSLSHLFWDRGSIHLTKICSGQSRWVFFYWVNSHWVFVERESCRDYHGKINIWGWGGASHSLSGKRVHKVGEPGPTAACRKQPLAELIYTFQRFLVTRPILENSSFFNCY